MIMASSSFRGSALSSFRGSAGPEKSLLAKLRRFFRGVEELFVGKAYASSLSSSGLTGGSIHWYHGDHLGSVNIITNSSGQQVELNEHKPFGSYSRHEKNPSVIPAKAGISSPHFTGQRLDSTTGLYYFHARYYDPELGRFTQPDTIVQAPSDPQSLNRYSYCRNNPIKFIDPTGHFFKKLWKKIKRAFGKIVRKIIAPIAAAITTIVTGNPFAGMAVYNQFATFGANLERGRGLAESWGRGLLAGYATAICPIGGSAAAAALSGQDPGRGAIMGAIQTATAAIGSAVPVPENPVMEVLRNSAIGAASGAAGAAAVGGDPGQGAWMGAASAAAVTVGMRISRAIANSNFQKASDIGQKNGGAPGKMVAEAEGVGAIRPGQSRQSIRGRFGLASRIGGASGALQEVQALSADMAPKVESIKLDTSMYGERAQGFVRVNDRISQGEPPGVDIAPSLGGLNVLRKIVTEWARWSQRYGDD